MKSIGKADNASYFGMDLDKANIFKMEQAGTGWLGVEKTDNSSRAPIIKKIILKNKNTPFVKNATKRIKQVHIVPIN